MEFYEKLCEEAEAERKQKKRNQPSGVYKYLSLVETKKEKFAYLRDAEGTIVSLPPLTNSENTRVRRPTRRCYLDYRQFLFVFFFSDGEYNQEHSY